MCYLTIRSDADYSSFVETACLVNFLNTLPELQQTGAIAFESASGQPWVSVILAECSPSGNYASSEEFCLKINVVELVCSSPEHAAWYQWLAGRIASFLGWSAFEDQNERQVWPP